MFIFLIHLVTLIFFSLSSQAGDLILNDKGKNIMTAIKTDEIGNSRVRVSAWMNAQHKSGLITCRLAGSIKPNHRLKPFSFERRITLLPGEFVPLHLGSYGRDFDPSEAITAKVNCEKREIPKAKSIKVRAGTSVCCSLGPVAICGSTDDDDGVVVDFESKSGKGSVYPTMEVCLPVKRKQ